MNDLIKAKESLNEALEKLGEAILNKAQQGKLQEHDGSEELQNCYNEIDVMQKELLRLGIENEDLKTENQDLIEAKDRTKLIAAQIKSDLSEIKSIINKK